MKRGRKRQSRERRRELMGVREGNREEGKNGGRRKEGKKRKCNEQ